MEDPVIKVDVEDDREIIFYSDYIVKTITTVYLSDPSDVKAMREGYITTLARTFYKYIPKIISVSENSITMEYAHGIPIIEYFLETPDHDNYRKLVNMVNDGNKILLKEGISHRDYGIGNLFVDEHDNLWIIDFGEAKIQELISPEEFDNILEKDEDVFVISMNEYLIENVDQEDLIPPEYRYEFILDDEWGDYVGYKPTGEILIGWR